MSKYEILVTPGSSKGRKRSFDYEECKKITDYCGAEVLTEMAYFAGFVVAGVYPSPIPHANVVTATTFKNLYGFGGELILSKETDLEIKLDNAVFYMSRSSDPECNCVQGCLGEAPKPDCVVYASQVLANACTLAKTIFENRIDVITLGTDTPLIDFSAFSVYLTIGLGCPWSFRLNLQEHFRISFWCGRQLCPLTSQIEKELSHIQPA